MITHVGHPQSEAVRAFIEDLLAEHNLQPVSQGNG